MPLAPLGHTLLTEPLPVVGGVFIPDLANRRQELPPPGASLGVYGPGADAIASELSATRAVTVVHEVEFYEEPVPERPRWRLWRADRWVEERASVPCQVLDYGCGSGRDAVALAAQGHLVTAYDILPDALERGRDLENRYGDGPRIEWRDTEPDAQFDVVLLLRCGRVELIERAWACVKPGGCMWLTSKPTHLPNAQVISLETDNEWTRAELRRTT